MSEIRHGSRPRGGREPDHRMLSGREIWRARPRLLVRLRSHLHAPELDRSLAAGADPLGGAQLLWRAQQLTDPHRRIEYAETIRRMIAAAEQDEPGPSSGTPPVRRDVIQSNRALLEVLAERMCSDQPLALRGLARVELLVGDCSPPYRGLSPFSLRSRLLEILAALDPFAG